MKKTMITGLVLAAALLALPVSMMAKSQDSAQIDDPRDQLLLGNAQANYDNATVSVAAATNIVSLAEAAQYAARGEDQKKAAAARITDANSTLNQAKDAQKKAAENLSKVQDLFKQK